MAKPQVTLIVVPREKFSYGRRSLESIYEHTDIPFELIYVDGRSPSKERAYLQAQARERGFTLLRRDAYLSPNQARNLALSRVQTPYVVFVDNDVVVTPNWLGPLVECAEATGASVVSPIICQGEPVHTVIHCAGGICGIAEKADGDGRMRRMLREHIAFQGRKLAAKQAELARSETQLAEFHCMLVRTDVFEKTGPLDEGLRNTREHIDFCIMVRQAGGTIYLEPRSVVTYVHNSELAFSDLGFYMVRWGNDWEQQSLQRMAQKWQLDIDDSLRMRLGNLGWRRRMYVLRPLSHRLTMGIGGKYPARVVERLLTHVERPVNRLLYVLNERRAQRAIGIGPRPVPGSGAD